MKKNREYIYSFTNTSCTLRIIDHLHNKYQSHLDSVAVISLIDRWLVKLSLKNSMSNRLIKNLQAFLNEMGSVSQPSSEIRLVLASLDRGESPTEVMNRYRVVVVTAEGGQPQALALQARERLTHGKPETEEIEIFRDRIVEELGYCPQNMA